jgi:hypothetical protein
MIVNRFILGSCACGCGISIPIRCGGTPRNKLQRFALGHQCRGQTYSEEHRQLLALSKISEKNPQWKGDEVKYGGLHDWVKRHLPKPEKCQTCGIKLPHDLSNKTGIYNRELINWWWLCRSCHMKHDYKNGTRMGKRKFHGAINYEINNFCARCKIKYGKDVYRCKNCKSRVRTKAWASNYSRKKRND